MKIITFFSDFGEKDWFVAAVKGEILKINRNVKVIDITHTISPFDIKSSAFSLKSVYKNFPMGTINLVVVDPGVGSERRPIIVQSNNYYFVGPDNGIFSYIYNKNSKVYKISFKKTLSSTFHARDISGPVAAKISKGARPKHLGVEVKDYVKFEFPKIRKMGTTISGEIIYIDHFGNLITNIANNIGLKELSISKKIIPPKNFYGEGEIGQIICVKGSSGYYEIAVNQASAQKILGARLGLEVLAKLQSGRKSRT